VLLGERLEYTLPAALAATESTQQLVQVQVHDCITVQVAVAAQILHMDLLQVVPPLWLVQVPAEAADIQV
jgi:hypothetical protein